ncbi:FMN reductase [Luteipulveratus halotolerans]|uniref:NADPH-dependent FMN reductase n=1 Tax=Luteipulveratus halotolerans TaxID=1631356 RepID=A0A0L6CMH2_9MICO|nr:FMN reductase [Luteipulveratus halotolerans]KNX38971.1 NADPH-dependent FMN reductase [Luteipulveratus halotolerans]
MTKIAVISAGLRDPSSTRMLADKLDAAVRSELGVRGVDATSEVVELRPLAHAIMDAMLTGFPSAALESAFETIASADAVIAVSPAFNASYAGLFKSFFDVLPEETLSGMPVLMGATGGTDRHSLVLDHAMRPMFSYLHAIVAPTAVYASTDDFGDVGASGGALGERVDRAASGFARLMQACGQHERRDTFSEQLSSMEKLLGGG